MASPSAFGIGQNFKIYSWGLKFGKKKRDSVRFDEKFYWGGAGVCLNAIWSLWRAFGRVFGELGGGCAAGIGVYPSINDCKKKSHEPRIHSFCNSSNKDGLAISQKPSLGNI